MLLEIRNSKIVQLIKRRNLLSVGLVVFILLNLIQAITVSALMNNTRIVIVPPQIRESFWVKPNKVSHEYLQQMTDYFLNIMLNVTPSSCAVRRETILKFVHPSGYGLVKEHLVREEEEVKKRQLSRFFVPVTYDVNNHEQWVKVLGDLTTLVGQEKVSIERVQYRVQYAIKNGELLIEAFAEEKPNV